MRRTTLLSTMTLAGVFSLTSLTGCMDSLPAENVAAGQSLRPEGTSAAEVPVPMNSVYLFEHDGFRGDAIRLDNVTLQAHDGLHKVEGAGDRMSSVRWNLPRGVVVLLHQHADGTGDHMTLWGQGEAASMDEWDFNDKLSRFSWHDLSGAVSQGRSIRPPQALPLSASLPTGVIEMFADADLKGTMSTLGPVNNYAMGARHTTDALHDRMSSLRWNLPPGVVVVFYEDAFKPGEQIAIWGEGQFNSISQFDFNDKITRWAWYDLTGNSPVGLHSSAAPDVVQSRTTVTTTPPPAPGAPGTTTITETKTTTVRTETVPPR